MKSHRSASIGGPVVTLSCLLLVGPGSWETARAADHGDTPALRTINRRDALITDLHVFKQGQQLVLSVTMNPAIPVGATSYQFPSDLTVRILIDRDSPVAFDNPADMATYGGTVMAPAGILEDVVFELTFPPPGEPVLTIQGLATGARQRVRLFTGLRDDPFIRGERAGRNVAAIVLQLPLSDVVTTQNTLLVWSSAGIPELGGPFQDMAARALRNMFPENDAMNSMHPSGHTANMGVPPDVVIFDTSRPTAFPNGRKHTDDVVDLVGDPRVTTTDAPFPSTNDVPFLAEFPYLGFAHGVGPPPVPTVSPWGQAALSLVLASAIGLYFSRRRADAA